MSYPKESPKDIEIIRALDVIRKRLGNSRVYIRHTTTGLKLELGKRISSKLIYLMAQGDYEEHDLFVLKKYLKKNDRYLEIGAGVGLCGLWAQKITQVPPILIEADPTLVPEIQHQFQVNRRVCILKNHLVGSRNKKPQLFFPHEDFWFSSIFKSKQSKGTLRNAGIKIKTIAIESLLKEHSPTAVMIDIEGAERDLFSQKLRSFPLPRLLFIEIHFPILGIPVGVKVINSILDLGYKMIDIQSQTFVFIKKE